MLKFEDLKVGDVLKVKTNDEEKFSYKIVLKKEEENFVYYSLSSNRIYKLEKHFFNSCSDYFLFTKPSEMYKK